MTRRALRRARIRFNLVRRLRRWRVPYEFRFRVYPDWEVWPRVSRRVVSSGKDGTL